MRTAFNGLLRAALTGTTIAGLLSTVIRFPDELGIPEFTVADGLLRHPRHLLGFRQIYTGQL